MEANEYEQAAKLASEAINEAVARGGLRNSQDGFASECPLESWALSEKPPT